MAEWTIDVDAAKRWIVARDDAAKTIAIREQRLQGGEWSPFNAMVWAADTVTGAARAITDIAAGRDAPPVAKAHEKLTIADGATTELARRVVPISDKRVLAVFLHGSDDAPEIMLREYKRAKGGWQIHGYLTFDRATAERIAKVVLG